MSRTFSFETAPSKRTRKARRRVDKSRHRRKHGFVNDLEDLVLRPSIPTTRRTVAWRKGWDGDDTPVFAPDYEYTPADLVPYAKYPFLLAERKRIKRTLAEPFRFLSLPTEVRVQIYRYCLVCERSIDWNQRRQELRIGAGDKVSVHLLRTCTVINDEAGQVFYGENRYRFPGDPDFIEIDQALPPHNLAWLKELTMSIPFAQKDMFLHRRCIEDINTVPPHNRIADLRSYRVDLFANRVTQYALDAVANAPRLQKLHFIVPPGWALKQSSILAGRDGSTPDKDGYLFSYLNASDVWDDLVSLVRARPFLHISVTRLHFRNQRRRCCPIGHERVMRKLKQRVGVWDQDDMDINRSL